MKKKLLVMAALWGVGVCLYAQEAAETVSDVVAEPVDAVAPKKWTGGFNVGVQLTQNFVSQNTAWSTAWYAGGTSNFAGMFQFEGWWGYAHNNLTWENDVELKYGLATNFSEDKVGRMWHMTDDLSKMISKLGYKARQDWFYTAEAEVSTTFFNSFPIDQDYVTSAFAAPVRFYFSLGMDYKWAREERKENFSLYLSPIAYKLVYVYDADHIYTKYDYDKGEATEVTLKEVVGVDQALTNDVGAMLKCNYRRDFNDRIYLESKLSLYTNYTGLGNSDHHVGIELDYELIANFVLYKLLTAQISVHPRYDTTGENSWTDREVDGKTIPCAKLQLKEYVSIGFNYTFAKK